MFDHISSPTHVSVDPVGRPRRVRTGGRRLAITALEAVRDETAAYPIDAGPRTVFVVRAGGGRYRLVHSLRDRHWTVEELPGHDEGLSTAA